jgi:hypothetical protein
MAQLATTPARGEVFSVLEDEDRFTSPLTSGSHYLEKCEEKPEVLFRLRKRMPLSRPKKVFDPYFLKFCAEFPELVKPEWSDTRMTWSDFSDESFKIGIAKYCRKMPKFDWNRKWEVAENWLHREFLPKVAGSRVQSYTETVSKMNLDTSPGPEMKFWFPTKEACVNSIDGRRVILGYLESLFSSIGGNLTIAGAHLKDELRPLHKVESHSTRIFICMGVLHTIGSHMLCMDFNEKMNKSASTDFPSCVGMSMFGGSFHRIAKHLLSFPHRVCTDIGKWDASVFFRMLAACCWLRWCAYAPEYKTEATWNALINTYIQIIKTAVMLPDGTIVLIDHQPSGQGNTAHDNTLINFLIQCFLWLDNGGDEDFKIFRNHVKPYLFGDDSIVGLSDYAYQFLNPTNIEKSYKKMGWECEFAPAMEFLGHYFLKDERLNSFVPVFPSYRAMGSLSRGGDAFDQSALVSKAMSIRLLTWTNKDFFPFVDRYCHWLVEQLDPHGKLGYRSQLHSEHMLMEIHREKARIGGFQPQCFGSRCIKSEREQSSPVNFEFECEKELEMSTAAKKMLQKNKKKKKKKKNGMKKASAKIARGTENQSLPAMSSLNEQVSRVRANLPSNFRSDPAVAGYVACLIDPANQPSVRIPDTNYGRQTALIASKKIVELTATIDTTKDSGRFAVAVQPTLGNTTAPPFYKVAIVDNTAGWIPTNQFADFESYITESGDLGSPDPRIDENFFTLTGPEPGLLYRKTIPNGLDTWGPLGAADDVAAGFYADFSYGLPKQGVILNGTPGANYVQCPPGAYKISTLTWDSAVPFTNNLTISAIGNSQISVEQNQLIQGGAISTEVIAVFGSDQDPSGLVDGISYEFRAPDQWTAASTSALISIVPIAYEPQGLASTVNPYLDGGIVAQYRPVAMSVLATCLRPELSNGGSISANWIPGSSINQNFFSNNPNQNVGALQFWENLARTPKAWNGRLEDGCYVYWSQEDREDFNFYKPSDVDAHDYPSIVISGVLQPGADGGTGTQPVLRLTIVTIYEMETLTTVFPTSSQSGTQATLDAVNLALLGESHACKNNAHMEMIRRMLAKVRNMAMSGAAWYGRNKGWVNPALEAIGGLLG